MAKATRKRKPAKQQSIRNTQTSFPAGLWRKHHAEVVITDPAPPPPSATETLTARQSTHGDFSENARVMQRVKRVLRTGENFRNFLNKPFGYNSESGLSDVQAEAIEMIVVKLGRIVTGDPNHADAWLDIEGYARLARERLA